MIGLRNLGKLDPVVRAELEQLIVAIQNIDVTDLKGYKDGETDTFLRKDGTFANPGCTMMQSLKYSSFRG